MLSPKSNLDHRQTYLAWPQLNLYITNTVHWGSEFSMRLLKSCSHPISDHMFGKPCSPLSLFPLSLFFFFNHEQICNIFSQLLWPAFPPHLFLCSSQYNHSSEINPISILLAHTLLLWPGEMFLCVWITLLGLDPLPLRDPGSATKVDSLVY